MMSRNERARWIAVRTWVAGACLPRSTTRNHARQVHTRAFRDNVALKVALKDETVEVTAAHVDVVEEAEEGWSVSMDGEYALALHTVIDNDLRLEGVAREVTRLVNDLRRRLGFALGEGISLQIQVMHDPSSTLANMLNSHADSIAVGVGARNLEYRLSPDNKVLDVSETLVVGDSQVAVTIERNERTTP